MSTETKFDLIRIWAEERGLYAKGDVKTQYVKLGEEFGELGKAIIQDNSGELVDAIGDMVVVLTNLAHLAGFKIEDCIDVAYDEIKDRKGSMANGSFVKQAPVNNAEIKKEVVKEINRYTGRVFECNVTPTEVTAVSLLGFGFNQGKKYREINDEVDALNANAIYLENGLGYKYYVEARYFTEVEPVIEK